MPRASDRLFDRVFEAPRDVLRFVVLPIIALALMAGLGPLSVLASGDPPVAHDGESTTREARPVDVFLFAEDPEFDPLTYQIVDPPEHGGLDDCTSGFCTYTPDTDPNFIGTDTFTWRANDGTSDSNLATHTVNVTANQAPVAFDQAESTREAKDLFIGLDASDDDFDELTFTIVDPPEHGTLDDCASGSCAYSPDPDPNYIGSDSFTWRASDGLTDSNVATFSIEVTANQSPIASDGTFLLREPGPAQVSLQATDADGDDLSLAVVDAPDHGTLDDCSSGFCTYTPGVTFAGSDSFTWRANDGLADSNVATITIRLVAGPAELAGAMAADPSIISGASYVTVPPNGTPNDVYPSGLSDFPTAGSAFAILTSGDAALAATPNDSVSSGASIGGGNVRGDTDFDVTILQIDLAVPAGMNCLRFDFAFYSEEYPEFVGSGFNDAFIAELDTSSWTTSENTITAADNFAFDPAGDVISINSTGATSMSADNAVGTTYDGATVLLQAGTSITPGPHSLYLSIFDQGDSAYDSAVFLDNLRLLTLADPETQCAEGAVEANSPPSADAGAPYAGDEGAAVSLDGTASDSDAGDTLTTTWSYSVTDADDGASCSFADAAALDTSLTCTDDGTYSLTLTVDDGVNEPVSDSAMLSLANRDPAVLITAPVEDASFAIDEPVGVSADVSDGGANDSHTCAVDWGDGTISDGTLVAGVCSGSHAYAAAGSYTISVSASDDDDGAGSDSVDIVVNAGQDHTLDVTLAGDGSGSVGSEPAGIDCPEDCSEDYEAGTSVTLTATEAPGSSFDGWSGDCTGLETCSLDMDAARSVTATFSADSVSASADLVVTQTDTPDPVTAGNLINYLVTVTNDGPDDATGVTLTSVVSADPQAVEAGCTTAGLTITCALGTIPAGGSVMVSIVVTAPTTSETTTVTNNATVDGEEDDPDTSNNASSGSTLVEPAPEDPDVASGWITDDGGTVATGAGKGPSKRDPMTTAVTVPPGYEGLVVIVEGPITDCPIGYRCFGQQAEITAPTTTADDPLRLVFNFHPSSLPPATHLRDIVMFHDDELVEPCTDTSGHAVPDPCIASVERVRGAIQVVVLSSENGSWRGGRL